MDEKLRLIYGSETSWKLESPCWDAGVDWELRHNGTVEVIASGHEDDLVGGVVALGDAIANWCEQHGATEWPRKWDTAKG